jgi:CdiI immunity protein
MTRQTRWPRVAYLFEAYFHQDCLVDDPSWEAVVDRFRENETVPVVRETSEQMLQLLAEASDDELSDFLFGEGFRCFFDPRSLGITNRQWMEEVVPIKGPVANARISQAPLPSRSGD